MLTYAKNMKKGIKPVKYSSLELEQRQVGYFRSLPEKQRRHFLAMEYLRLGEGSQRYLAKLFGCGRQTIRNGVKELKESDFDIDYSHQRSPGGGRKKKNA